ncbi:hypothetical protein BG910_00180 [Neisseria chenwenguii]|uniref:OmpA-like domain-containing protein n=1 Tax=Neisseria chenwenguii TaxID=1853278 RepID=A0A220RYT3_9NEIS|nr:hypothetical protein BG910_00180 [Neisseria chenwenguii]
MSKCRLKTNCSQCLHGARHEIPPSYPVSHRNRPRRLRAKIRRAATKRARRACFCRTARRCIIRPRYTASQTYCVAAIVGSNLRAQGGDLSAQTSGLTGKRSGFDIEIKLSADVLFDFDKAVLKPEADPELERAAKVIREKGRGEALIVGYTDAKGSDGYNPKRSKARADAVKAWFEAHGVALPIRTEGCGAADPVAPNTSPDGSDNPEGRAKSRRVEVLVNKTKQLGE